MATAFEFDVTRDASAVARWWSGRATRRTSLSHPDERLRAFLLVGTAR